ncbi:SGNH hydrolase-like domain-containing protein, acetyltransferase AlgX [Pseudobutyrivibrio sp. YE44]|uniref:alginate O-acetyltransferase AlgX-related protein n=1 Tax=Pseudobutyrivibrio sp. YE44 TaxID=1520802 RepID=UPI000886CAB0|nr:hypothetical protein [Pseudobutyrivibrio sp. YE44]SDB31327.1 SGNH hydrolase-like domain-containing protein, acetyltransferase AlgX [Pseudobutyrivibrio sp. YE44]
MNLKNLKNKIFILIFLGVLVFPWVGGGALRIFAPSTFKRLSVVETEKREMQQIEWANLLNTGESMSGFIDDRIPFRYTMISWYKELNDIVDAKYQQVAIAVGQRLYSAQVDNKQEVDRGQTNKPIVPGEEAPITEPEEQVVDDNYFPLHVYQDVIIARDGWLFLYGENEIECYQGTNLLDEDTINHYISISNRLKSICDAQGKQVYIYIAPNKSSVYPQYMPSVERVTDFRRIQRLYERMQNESSMPFIYPLLEELQASSQSQVYYKYDTHWNHMGGLFGTNALYASMGVEQTDPFQWVTGTEDAEKYELYTYMGIPDSMVTHDDVEAVVDYRPDVAVDGLTNPEKMIIHTTSNGANQKKLCFIGDSFRVNMVPYLTKDFTQCTIAHRDYMSDIHADIKNADVIVIEAVERYDYEAFNTVQRVINVLSN